MKKNSKITLLLLFSTIFSCFLTSCKKKKNNIAKICIESTYEASSCIELNKTELSCKLAYTDESMRFIEGDNFILYVYSQGCSTCARFENNILNSYISDAGIDIYKIEESLLEGVLSTSNKYSTYPLIKIFNKGQVFTQESYNSNQTIFENKSNFQEYINNYVSISKMKKINNETDLDNLLDSSNPTVVYGWNKCGDCSYLESNFLDTTKYDESINDFYYFEVDEYRKHKNTINNEIWVNFINKYGLNINNNTGVVPTIVHYTNKIVDDYVIYLNDNLISENDKLVLNSVNYNDNSSKIGKIYNSIEEYRNDFKEFYNNKLSELLNKYLKK